jgi:cytochrome c peroxidase
LFQTIRLTTASPRAIPRRCPPKSKRARYISGQSTCSACHAGPNLTDERFHNTGIAWPNTQLRDPGRFRISGQPEDRGAFEAPALREVARTAPYLHDGSLATLEVVVNY